MNLEFCCFKLDNTTDKMYLAIKNAFPNNVIITETLKPEEFLTSVKASIISTVSRHGEHAKSLEKEEEKKSSNLDNVETFKARRLTYRF